MQIVIWFVLITTICLNIIVYKKIMKHIENLYGIIADTRFEMNNTRFEMDKIKYDRSNYGKRTNRNIQK